MRNALKRSIDRGRRRAPADGRGSAGGSGARAASGGARVALLLVSCVVAFAAAEVTIRLAAPQWALQGLDFFVVDPEVGWRLAPNHDGEMTNQVEYRVRVRTDARGLRIGSEHGAGGPVVLGLGDSYQFGFGVEGEETLLARASDRLRVRAANAGVPGYGPCQAARLGIRLLGEIRPQATVLTIFLGNDERDAARGSGFLEVRDGALVSPGWRPSPLRPILHPLFEHSHLVRFVRFSAPVIWAEQKLMGRQDEYREALGDVLLAEKPDPPAEIAAGDDAMAQCLPALSAAAAASGAPLLAVLIPDWTEIDPVRLAADAAVVGQTGFDPDRPRQRVQRLLEYAGIPFLDLEPEFRAGLARGENLYYPIDRHLNSNGHRMASEALVEPLRRMVGAGSGSGAAGG